MLIQLLVLVFLCLSSGSSECLQVSELCVVLQGICAEGDYSHCQHGQPFYLQRHVLGHLEQIHSHALALGRCILSKVDG